MQDTMLLLTDIALITGAGRGIGKAIARELSTQGIETLLVSRSEAEINGTRDEIVKAGGKATAYICDLSKSEDVRKLCEQVLADHGSVSILVNNAGLAKSFKLEETTEALWEQMIATNVTAPFLLAQAFVPKMKEAKRGFIINIASTAALYGFSYASAYCASKHALLGLSRALDTELKRAGIHVASIMPGFVKTDVLMHSIENIAKRTGRSLEDAEAELAALNRSGRIIAPEEIAKVVFDIITEKIPSERSEIEIQ
jgi:NAD(P)-dependent dehydrogenase (short-subunit alcohol dehydrogenase family)